MQNMVNGIVEKTRNHISPTSIESIVPDAPLRTVSAHEGGAYTIAFDRYARPPLSVLPLESPSASTVTVSAASVCTQSACTATPIIGGFDRFRDLAMVVSPLQVCSEAGEAAVEANLHIRPLLSSL